MEPKNLLLGLRRTYLQTFSPPASPFPCQERNLTFGGLEFLWSWNGTSGVFFVKETETLRPIQMTPGSPKGRGWGCWRAFWSPGRPIGQDVLQMVLPTRWREGQDCPRIRLVLEGSPERNDFPGHWQTYPVERNKTGHDQFSKTQIQVPYYHFFPSQTPNPEVVSKWKPS